MSTLCERNEKVKQATDKHDFYDFGIASYFICKQCDSTNSEECLMEKAGFIKLKMEDNG